MKTKVIKSMLLKFHWFISNQVGINIFKFFRFIPYLFLFFRDYILFKREVRRLGLRSCVRLLPCLHDKNEEAGVTKSEYFWQDLFVARSIFESKPQRHVDIGSRVDGFVSHVASFREIEVFDVRPISSQIPGIVFRKADLMTLDILSTSKWSGYCDSLSCLHAIEHFGLGRYGDPLNPEGYRVGLKNMIRLLSPGGIFYLSTPIGRERVEFNANWVFDPRKIILIATENRLRLDRLTIYSREYGVQEIPLNETNIDELAAADYHLGVFTFIKQVEN